MSLHSVLSSARESAAAVARNRGLRRVQLALAATALTTPAYAVALSVYAYREGGVRMVALTGVVTFLPAGLLAPVLSLLADRGRRERVLAGALAVRGVTLLAGAACVFLGLPSAAVLALAAIASIASRLARPAQAALVPSLARDNDELSAANALAATVDEVGTILGPALAGAVLLVTGPDPVIALSAAAALGAALTARGVQETEAPPAPGQARLLAELLAGFAAIGAVRGLRAPVLVLTLQTACFGAVGVLMVALALDRLALGNPGLGLLELALGVGGIVGGVLALGFATTGRLGACLGAGAAAWGAAIALLGVYPQTAVVLALFLAAGVAGIFVDVPAYTLIQSATASALVGRVFGALEGLGVVGTALGAALAPVLSTTLGLQGALVAVGATTLAVALVSWRELQRLDRSQAPATSELVEQPQAI